MTSEKFDKKLLGQCVDNHKLTPTISSDSQDSYCSVCNTAIISMRLDRSPNTGAGFIPSKDQFLFYGCPKCSTIHYDEDELFEFAGKECALKDFLIEVYKY